MDLPLGTGTIDVSLPDCEVTVARPTGGTTVDVRAAAERALEDPIGPPLADRVDPDDDVAIVVTDITRKAPDDVLLDVLLERLERCGVAREQVTVVVGLGLHRPMTDDEIEAMLGPHADLAVNHDPESVVEVGTVSKDDVPVEIGEPVVEGDGGQYTDSKEAARIADLIETYEAAGLERTDIGVIAPFRAQGSEISKHVPDEVAVDTVDRFQGSSQEVIIVSFTATGALEGPIFEDYRRINVALTRPKRALVLVGDANALATDPVYERMVEWATR
ncbi:hypothetical protein C477_09334 [Haloterrigena salina JCM 13891]|uniref:LarA-like N-terminal domain-containing protein n=1 Tax=Haloterrigena salina JCM 13891 TaxID=1227488 RepID=M0C733_9EURY|nr:lactate racemase domain-containing protein [Haloterrigena salina]ELZ19066.1 hypothetical protein C477_09334 [Haloterrigena salina JCM 13891]